MGIPNVTYLKLGHLFLPQNLAFLPSLTSKLMAMSFFCGAGQKPCNHTNHSLSHILPIKIVSKTYCHYFQNRPRVQPLLTVSITIITSCLNYCSGLPSGLLALVLVPVSLLSMRLTPTNSCSLHCPSDPGTNSAVCLKRIDLVPTALILFYDCAEAKSKFCYR